MEEREKSRRSHDEFFHGKTGGRLVVVGPINLPVGRLFIEEVITECRKRGATRVDVLAFGDDFLDEQPPDGQVDRADHHEPPAGFAVEKGIGGMNRR